MVLFIQSHCYVSKTSLISSLSKHSLGSHEYVQNCRKWETEIKLQLLFLSTMRRDLARTVIITQLSFISSYQFINQSILSLRIINIWNICFLLYVCVCANRQTMMLPLFTWRSSSVLWRGRSKSQSQGRNVLHLILCPTDGQESHKLLKYLIVFVDFSYSFKSFRVL